MDDWWIEPMRRAFGGRRVVLAGAMGASWTEHIDLLRSVGVTKLLVVATEGRGAGPQPDVPTVIVEPREGLSEMERIHFADRTLADPTPEMIAAVDRFDPRREAIVIGTFLATAVELAGRPFVAHRRPEWVALEDKVVVDAFWDRAGIERQPSVVVPLNDAPGAAVSIDRGDGTVWAADARDGFHGGAHQTYWVNDDMTRDRALGRLRAVCDTVRVMPFLDGIPCSIHGIVLPDGVAVLRPVEMLTLRRGSEFVYAGCATYWDPAPSVRERMRSIARVAGEQLALEVDFRGTFTVDGVVTADGFWPTELNPRFGAGIMTIARAARIPMVLVNDLIVAGHDIGRTAVELEADVVAHGDARRGGGTWMGGLDNDLEVIGRPVTRNRDDTWSWAEPDDEIAGRVTAGSGFIRCIYEPSTTPVGPSTGPRAAAFWDFVDREWAVGTGGLASARDVGIGVSPEPSGSPELLTHGEDGRMTTSPILPGRLGNPSLDIRDDPRADPRMIAAMAPLGMDVAPAPSPVNAATPIDELIEFFKVAEAGYDILGEVFFANPTESDGVSSYTETITGVDGNDITLYIHRPDSFDAPLPCIVHTHGGGMTILKASNPSYVKWRDDLAASGLVVVGVEFRNAGGALGPHPFPAGLNDCALAVQWVIANRAALGVSKVVVSGESGGGNLSIATALKARQEGWIDDIAGVYAQCPFISGQYTDPPPELTSLFENDKYFIDIELLAAMVTAYNPDGSNATNPLAWPMHALPTDLAGLPPHVISVNQLDPLRDEGLVYFRKLLDAGVSAVSRTVNGTCHAGDCLFLEAMPEVWHATIRDIKGFAESL